MFTCVERQITPSDPIWQVTLCNLEIVFAWKAAHNLSASIPCLHPVALWEWLIDSISKVWISKDYSNVEVNQRRARLVLRCVTVGILVCNGSQSPRSTQPGHPLWVGTLSTSESWDVNTHNMWCASPICVISQCKLVSGWELSEQKSALADGPCGLEKPLKLLLTRYLCSLSRQQKSSNRNVWPDNDEVTSADRSSLVNVLNARLTYSKQTCHHPRQCFERQTDLQWKTTRIETPIQEKPAKNLHRKPTSNSIKL